MKSLLLLPVLFTCLSSVIISQNKDINQPFHRIRQTTNNHKTVVDIQYRKKRIETFHKEQSLNKQNRVKQQNEVVYRPVKLIVNDIDSSIYAPKITTYTYNSNGKCLTELTQIIINGITENDNRATYTYDNSGNCLTDLYEEWKDNVWENYSRYTNTYDNTDNCITGIKEVWDEGNWVNDYKFTTTYNNSGYWITDIYESWNENKWVTEARYSATRDNDDYLISELMEIWWENDWSNYYKISFTYNNYGDLISEKDEVWIGDTWQDYFRYSATYNNDGFWLTELYEDYDSTGTFVPSIRYSATYDNENNILVDLSEEWTVTGSWSNNTKKVYNYDSNNNAVHGEYLKWEEGEWVPVWGDMNLFYDNHNKSLYASGVVAEVEYTSFIVSGVSDESVTSGSFDLSQNYPNPFNPITNIKYQIGNSGFVTLKIYNILGKEIATLVNEEKPAGLYNINFIADNIASGIYYYQIKTGGFIQSKKMILLK